MEASFKLFVAVPPVLSRSDVYSKSKDGSGETHAVTVAGIDAKPVTMRMAEEAVRRVREGFAFVGLTETQLCRGVLSGALTKDPVLA